METKKELKHFVTIDKKQLDETTKKFPAVSEKEIEKWVVKRCEYFNKKKDLEKYGFENGMKFDFNDQIKDFILFVDLNYKETPTQEDIDEFKKKKPVVEEKEELEIYKDEELLIREFPEPRWIIKNQIPESEVGILAGKRGERKTFFALYQALCISAGLTCAEDEVKKKRKVFYVSEEDSIRALLPRIKALKKGLGIEKEKLGIKYFIQNNLKLDEVSDKTALFHMEVKEFKPDLIIVDTLQRCVSFDVDVDNRSVSEFFTGTIRPITKALGCSWLFIHHLRKGLSGTRQADDLMDEIRGASEIVNYPRFVLICQVPKQSKDMMVLTPVKMSHAELSDPKVLSFINLEEEQMIKISYVGLPKDVLKMEIKCAEAIKDFLFKQHITEFRTKDMIEKEEELGYKRSMITGALKILVEQDYLEKIKRGYYKIKGGNQAQLMS